MCRFSQVADLNAKIFPPRAEMRRVDGYSAPLYSRVSEHKRASAPSRPGCRRGDCLRDLELQFSGVGARRPARPWSAGRGAWLLVQPQGQAAGQGKMTCEPAMLRRQLLGTGGAVQA